MKLREALQALVNAIDNNTGALPSSDVYERALDEARAALAEPVADEPVAPADYDKHRACPSHCCPIHGCKYGHDDCPVATGKVQPQYPNNNSCEDCEWEEANRPAPAPAERGEYPPLPDEDWRTYTADQMRAYVDADRAQRAKP